MRSCERLGGCSVSTIGKPHEYFDLTGYTRLRGALKNLGHELGRNTIKRLLAEHGIAPAPERGKSMSWSTFLKAHWGCAFYLFIRAPRT